MLKKLYLFVVRNINVVAIIMTVAFVVGCFVSNLWNVAMLIVTIALFCLTHYGNSKCWWEDV